MSSFSNPDFGSSTFATWRDASDWNAYTRHDFVHKLGDGSLPRESFLHYLVQDYIFLVHFSRAWALALVKSDSLDEMRTAASTVDALVNHEMQLHIATCTKEGISEDTLFNAEEAQENLAYTRYVMDAGLSGDFLDLMAVLAPCILGYGDIGLYLKQTAAKDTPYIDWINTYSGEEYQQVCMTVGQLIEQATLTRLGTEPQNIPRFTKLSQHFSIATRLEVGFWDMGLRGHQ